MVHLGDLRLLERALGSRKIGAGIRQFPIEPQRVERVAEIVVGMDVVARVGERVGAASPRPVDHLPRGRCVVRQCADQYFEQFDHAAIDLDRAVAVAFAKLKRGIDDELQQAGTARNAHVCHLFCGSRRKRVPIPQADAHRWLAQGFEKNANQLAIDRKPRRFRLVLRRTARLRKAARLMFRGHMEQFRLVPLHGHPPSRLIRSRKPVVAADASAHWRRLGASHLRRHRRTMTIFTLAPGVNCFNVSPGKPRVLINIKHGAKPAAACKKSGPFSL